MSVVDQARTSAGQWIVVYGCGGVGLSAITIANAVGANVVAVDISESALAMAKSVGAAVTINATDVSDVVGSVIELTQGGARISLDALGSRQMCISSINSLPRRGKHVQVGLMLGDQATPASPMSKVITHELEILGSHGMQAHRYGAMLDMIRSEKVRPELLIGTKISLADSIEALTNMNGFTTAGVTVVTDFLAKCAGLKDPKSSRVRREDLRFVCKTESHEAWFGGDQ